MKKILAISIAVLTFAIGLFVGAVCLRPVPFCPKGHAPEMQMPPPFEPQMAKRGDKRPAWSEDKFKKQKQQLPPEAVDSLLKVTAAQKEALEKHRILQDSTFKALKKEKKEAEIELRKALEAETFDANKVEAAKKRVLLMHEKILNAHVEGVKYFSEVLSVEQRETFHKFVDNNPKPRFVESDDKALEFDKGPGKGHDKGPKGDFREGPHDEPHLRGMHP